MENKGYETLTICEYDFINFPNEAINKCKKFLYNEYE